MSATKGRYPHVPPRWRDDVWELRCRSCGDWWPLTEDFYSPRHGVARCKACWAAYWAGWQRNKMSEDGVRRQRQDAQRAKYAADPELRARRAAALKAWKDANREHVRAYARELYARKRAANRLEKAA